MVTVVSLVWCEVRNLSQFTQYLSKFATFFPVKIRKFSQFSNNSPCPQLIGKHDFLTKDVNETRNEATLANSRPCLSRSQPQPGNLKWKFEFSRDITQPTVC